MFYLTMYSTHFIYGYMALKTKCKGKFPGGFTLTTFREFNPAPFSSVNVHSMLSLTTDRKYTKRRPPRKPMNKGYEYSALKTCTCMCLFSVHAHTGNEERVRSGEKRKKQLGVLRIYLCLVERETQTNVSCSIALITV